MGDRLRGKVAVITGAAGGIGREAALLFSEEGARVCVADVGREAGEKTASECHEAFFFPADVSNPTSVQAVNAKGVYLCCKYGIPYLLKVGGGSVINVASFVALVGAATSQIAYTASKGAVLSMSRELGVQFARQGVRVNALCPGPVETPLLMRIFNEDPGAYQRRRVHLPMGRLAKAREIANAALFLASDESSYVNGATFLVDGGLTAAYVTPE